MFLSETPHIRIRRANGLYNIDYTACDIIGLNQDSSTAAARSYNTIIGVYTRTSSGSRVYLETGAAYSQTTASKHKPRAAAIASYNGFQIIPEIKPDVLREVYFYGKTPVDEIIKEAETRQQLLQELHNNDNNGPTIKDLKVKGIIKAAREPESHQYKNGNHLEKYFYQTKFKYVYNVQYELNQKATKYTRPAFNSPTGPRPEATGYKVQNRIVNIRE